MKKQNLNVFPQTLHMKREIDGDTSYFVADTDLTVLAEAGEAIHVATYTLVERRVVSLVVKAEKA